MNDLRKLSRILLIGIGIYFLINIIYHLIAATQYLFIPGLSESFRYIRQMSISLIYYIAFGIAVIFFLIKKADFWAEIIVGSEDQKADLPRGFWIPVTFRLAAVIVGILCLFWFLSNIFSTISDYIIFREKYLTTISVFFNLKQLITWTIQIALSIYLLCGAPHFVRWHTKKILEQISNDSKPTDSEVSSSQE